MSNYINSFDNYGATKIYLSGTEILPISDIPVRALQGERERKS